MRTVKHISVAREDAFSVDGAIADVEVRKYEGPVVDPESTLVDELVLQSTVAQPSTMTYSLVSSTGEPVGYVSFQVLREEFLGTAHVFVDVEAIYIKQAFRRRGLSLLLRQSVIREVQASLHVRTHAGRYRGIYIHFASEFKSLAGKRVLRALEEDLFLLAKRHAGVSLLGQRHQHPCGAKERILGKAEWHAVPPPGGARHA